jgi:hypothetical protein
MRPNKKSDASPFETLAASHAGSASVQFKRQGFSLKWCSITSAGFPKSSSLRRPPFLNLTLRDLETPFLDRVRFITQRPRPSEKEAA